MWGSWQADHGRLGVECLKPLSHLWVRTLDQLYSPSSNPRDKPFLFYFNIVKCANPLVLLEFHCPTPQVTHFTSPP